MELSIDKKPAFDSRVVEREVHAHLPYGSSTIGPSDEARFVIQHQDLITATYDSFLFMEATITPADDTKTYRLTNNAVAFMFDEIRFELGDQIIETVRNPGITTTLKGLVSLNPLESKELEIAGWSPTAEKLVISKLNAANKEVGFTAVLPLKFLFGFAEDYNKVVANMRQTLVLRRSRTDNNCSEGTTSITITINKLEWRVPYLKLSDAEKLKMLSNLNKDDTVQMAYRKRELYTLPSLRNSKIELSNLSTKTDFSKPRYVLVGLQTNKENNVGKDGSVFESLNITNVTVYLNEKAHPYAKSNLNFAANDYMVAYKNYCDFRTSYYRQAPQPLLSYAEFLKNPVFVVDCSKQQDDVKAGTVDIKVELESSVSFPANTYAFVLILHDALVNYRPLTNLVVHQQL